jgi:hypothetical protein
MQIDEPMGPMKVGTLSTSNYQQERQIQKAAQNSPLTIPV